MSEDKLNLRDDLGFDEDELDENLDDTDYVRYLTFVTDGLVFGVSSENVVEIINNHIIRPIPLVPNYVMGVINLRGQIVPIVDMRLRMHKEFKEYDARTCTIILNIDSNTIGVVVDSVQQVLDIDMNSVSPMPIKDNLELTNSMIQVDNSVILLLECDELVHNQL